MDAGKLLFGRLEAKSWVGGWLKLEIRVFLREFLGRSSASVGPPSAVDGMGKVPKMGYVVGPPRQS